MRIKMSKVTTKSSDERLESTRVGAKLQGTVINLEGWCSLQIQCLNLLNYKEYVHFEKILFKEFRKYIF